MSSFIFHGPARFQLRYHIQFVGFENGAPFLFQRPLDLELKPARSLKVRAPNSPRLVLGRFERDRASTDDRPEIPVTIVACKADGGRTVDFRRIQNQGEITEKKSRHPFVLEVGFCFPHALEPGEGSV